MAKKGNNGFFQQFWSSLTGSGVRLQNGLARNAGLQSTAPFNRAVEPPIAVTEEVALQVSAVFAAVKLYSDTISTLPLKAYRRKSDGSRVELHDHWSLDLIGSPNGYMDSGDLMTQLTYSLVLSGNCYAVLNRVAGRVRGILPVQPSQVLVYLTDDGALCYKYTHDGEVDELTRKDMLHVKTFGNGLVGISPIQWHAGSIGTSSALDKLVSDIYRSGGRASGLLSIDNVLTDAQRAAIKRNFDDIANNPASRLHVLEAGMQFTPVSLSPQDIELLESRKFQIADIGRIFSVPAVLLDSSDKGSWASGFESVLSNWHRTGLGPILARLERGLNRALFSDVDKDVFLEFSVEKLLRAEPKERMETYLKAFQCSALTINEIRKLEGFAPVELGDLPRAAVNVLPLDSDRKLGDHNIPSSNDMRGDNDGQE